MKLAHDIRPRVDSSNCKTGITEIVLPSSSDTENEFVLPMLAHLSRQCEDKWFTWIAPRGINRRLLTEYGFALDKVRIIYTRESNESLWVLWEALMAGNSQTVVLSHDRLSENDLKLLEEAAHAGGTQGLLLHHREACW